MAKIKIYVDCTDTVTLGSNTGIQRTVRQILNRIDIISFNFNVEVVPVVSVYSKYYKYNYHNSRHFYTSKLIGFFLRARNLLDVILKRSQNTIRTETVSVTTLSLFSHSRLIDFCRGIMPAMLMFTYRLDKLLLDDKSVLIGDKDILFLPDAFWNESSCKSFIKTKAGIKVLIVYDIIPIKYPDACDDYYNSIFVNYLNAILTTVNGIISISKAELENVKMYCNKITQNKQYDYFYLGADFGSVTAIKGGVRDILQRSLLKNNFYLIVGSIEPRKNHDYVLDVFEKLWAQGLDISLCIVGKVHLKSKVVKERVYSNANFNRRLFIFDDLSDNELSFCYDNCRAVIFPSRAEGFGLPLVEAMHYGKPVLASDIPVFREIGADYPIFFSLEDEDSLCRAIYDIESLTATNTNCQAWISWDESINQLFAKIIAMSKSIEASDIVKPVQSESTNSCHTK